MKLSRFSFKVFVSAADKIEDNGLVYYRSLPLIILRRVEIIKLEKRTHFLSRSAHPARAEGVHYYMVN